MNKILAHQPWKMNRGHIEKLARSRVCGSDNWGMGEIVHAIIVLTHFHALSSFVFSAGINHHNESDCNKIPTTKLSAKTLRSPPNLLDLDDGDEVETIDQSDVQQQQCMSTSDCPIVASGDPTGLKLPLKDTTTTSTDSAIVGSVEGANAEERKDGVKGKEVEHLVSSPSCIMIKKAFVDDSPPPELSVGSPLNEGSVEVSDNSN